MKEIKFALLLCGLTLAIMQSEAQNNKARAVLNHQAIYVMDLKKAGDFYMDIIGLEKIEEPFKVGKHIWLKTGPKTSLHIILGAPERKEYYKNHHMCFSVLSLEAFIKKLDKKGVSYENSRGQKSEITKRPDGIRQIWIQDPDGYWIEINDDQSSF